LDDVFSALDAETAKSVFESLFGTDGALKSQATILVTHATKFLQRMDHVVVLSDGSTVFSGSFSDLQAAKGVPAIDSLGHSSSQSVESGQTDYDSISDQDDNQRPLEDQQTENIIMTKEDREFGLSHMATWLVWFQYAGGWTFFLTQIIFLVFDRTMYVASEWWISKWTEAYDESIEVFGREFPPQTEGRSAQIQYLVVYYIILVLSVIGTTLRSHWGVQGGARCAEKLFAVMISAVLGAPLSYFETTPLGRILNRFTYDIEVLDIELSVSMAGLLISFSWFAASIVVMVRPSLIFHRSTPFALI